MCHELLSDGSSFQIELELDINSESITVWQSSTQSIPLWQWMPCNILLLFLMNLVVCGAFTREGLIVQLILGHFEHGASLREQSVFASICYFEFDRVSQGGDLRRNRNQLPNPQTNPIVQGFRTQRLNVPVRPGKMTSFRGSYSDSNLAPQISRLIVYF